MLEPPECNLEEVVMFPCEGQAAAIKAENRVDVRWSGGFWELELALWAGAQLMATAISPRPVWQLSLHHIGTEWFRQDWENLES